MQPDTLYAKSGDLHIAYQAFGAGSVDLVLVPGFISNVEETWDNPERSTLAGATRSVCPRDRIR